MTNMNNMNNVNHALGCDQSHFFLKIKNFPRESFQILSFQCDNDDISADYCFKITLLCEQFYDPSALLNQPAILSWQSESGEIYRHGFITTIAYRGKTFSGLDYYCELFSPLHPLTLRMNNRVFVNKSIQEIITQVLQAAGWPANLFWFELEENYKTLAYTVQFDQTDASFLQQLLTRFAIQFVWQQFFHTAKLKFIDQLSVFNTSQNISQVNPIKIYRHSIMPNKFNFNLVTTVHVQTTRRDLQPGNLIEINRQVFKILKIEHLAQQNINQLLPEQSGLTYQAMLQLISPATNLQVSYINPPCRILFNAKIESTSDYATLDQQGDYFLRLMFDDSGVPLTQASPALSKLQPYGGNVQNQLSYGLHFPLRQDTEVLLMHLDGDINQPIVIGAISNVVTPAPVNASNFTQNIWRTWGGSTLILDDKANQSQLSLATAGQQNILLLDASHEAAQVQLTAKQGNLDIYADQILNISSQDSQLRASQLLAQVKVFHQQEIITQQAEITFHSGANIALTAATNLVFQTNKQNFTLTAGQEFMQQVASALVWQTSLGDIAINSPAGNSLFFAKTGLTLSANASLNLLQATNRIVLNAESMLLSGTVIKINAQQINCPPPNS